MSQKKRTHEELEEEAGPLSLEPLEEEDLLEGVGEVPEEVVRSSLGTIARTYLDYGAVDRLLSRDEERELLLMVQAGKRALAKLSERYGLSEGEVVAFLDNEAPHPILDDPLVPFVERMREARRTLILANVRLVLSVAYRYALQHRMSLQDLAQEGMLGLMEAIEKFDASRGVKLSTYATWRIRYAVQRGISSMLPGPMRGEVYQPNLSLDASPSEDEDPLGTTIPSSGPSPEERAEKIMEGKRVAEALRKIEPRLAFIVMARYGLMGVKAMDTQEIAERLRITPSRVSELERRALELLRAHLEERRSR